MVFSRQQLARGYHNVKRGIGHVWDRAVYLGRQADQFMTVGKRLLAATSPIFDQLGQGHHHKALVGAVGAFDKAKSDVMYGHNNILNHYNRIKRQVPELDL